MSRAIVIFGAGLAGERAFARLGSKEDVVAFVDNDVRKHGQYLCGLPIIAPDKLLAAKWDIVVVASSFAREICDQLRNIGVSREQVELDLSPPDPASHAAWTRRYAPALLEYRDMHKGEDCFILGNGPSLRSVDLSRLNGYNTFGLNKIHLAFAKTNFRPTYHVAINGLVIEQCWDDFTKLRCPSFLSYVHSFQKELAGDNIRLLYTSHSHGFSKDVCDLVCEGFTVTYVAMQLAWYMGFSRVFLIGVDHRFQAKGAPNETQVMGVEDPNHFDSSYFANQSWQLPDLEGSEFSYRIAKQVFTDSDPQRIIYDATEGGSLEVFPKIDFETALQLCRAGREGA